MNRRDQSSQLISSALFAHAHRSAGSCPCQSVLKCVHRRSLNLRYTDRRERWRKSWNAPFAAPSSRSPSCCPAPTMSAWRVPGTSRSRPRTGRPRCRVEPRAALTTTTWTWTKWVCTARRTADTDPTRRASSSLQTGCECFRRSSPTDTALSPARCATGVSPWTSGGSGVSHGTGWWNPSLRGTSRAAPPPRPPVRLSASCVTATRWTRRSCASSATSTTVPPASSGATRPAVRSPNTAWCRRNKRQEGRPAEVEVAVAATAPLPGEVAAASSRPSPRGNLQPAWTTKWRTSACTAAAAKLRCVWNVWRRGNTPSTTWNRWPSCGSSTKWVEQTPPYLDYRLHFYMCLWISYNAASLSIKDKLSSQCFGRLE